MSDSSQLKSLFSRTPVRQTTTNDDNEVVPDVSPNAKIIVVGIGGGGGNAINDMIAAHIEGVEYVALNTDAQSLYHNSSKKKINIGKSTTKGLGAGSNPQIGARSAEESSEEIRKALEGADMVFITCGLGGGTGTGAAPVVAEIARELGALTVAIVTRPFTFEGATRKKHADDGLDQLKQKVDTMIVIPNDRILGLIDKKKPLLEAFQVVNDVLRQGVEGIASLITVHGLINVDFADVQTVMKNSGSALMGIGYATGENRAVEAARIAINSPLLDLSIKGAKGILLNITGGNDLSMFEVDEAAKVVVDAADPEAHIIFGAVINEEFTGEVKVTVIATGFSDQQMSASSAEHRTAWGNTIQRLGASQDGGMPSTEEDLEIPAFLRKSLKK